MRRFLTLAGAAGALALALPAAAPAAAKPLVAGYWGAYTVYDRGYYPKQIPAGGLSVLYVDLAEPSADSRCTADAELEHGLRFSAARSVDGRADPAGGTRLKGVMHQIQLLRARHPGLKVLVTVAQLDPARAFALAASTPARRARFVRSCIDRYIRGRYPGVSPAVPGLVDGIDLDWEVPHGAKARHDYTLLAGEFRRQLRAVRPGLLMTAALPADGSVPQSFELGAVARSLDWINLMGYDLHGPWDDVALFNAPLHATRTTYGRTDSVARAVAMYRAAGVPRSKIVLGVPFYGRGYAGVDPGPGGSGLGQPFSGVAMGPGFSDGQVDYRTLVADVLPGASVHRDAQAAQAWVYDAAARRLVVYDDPTTIAAKAAFARAQGLRGAMFWELSEDTAGSTLLRALRRGLGRG